MLIRGHGRPRTDFALRALLSAREGWERDAQREATFTFFRGSQAELGDLEPSHTYSLLLGYCGGPVLGLSSPTPPSSGTYSETVGLPSISRGALQGT